MAVTKYWLDTEFIEDGSTIDLLSIGIVADDGRTLYLCNRDVDLRKADEWVVFNVYPYLNLKHGVNGWFWNEPKKQSDTDLRWDKTAIVVPKTEIRDRVREFIGTGQVEFWAYYADYDWVAFCQLFGRMVDLPKTFPMYCHDVKQLCDSIGGPEIPKRESGEHHALADAKWTKWAYEFLIDKMNEGASV